MAVEMLEGDWVTWDFVTFYKQDGLLLGERNTFVVSKKENWRDELEAHMEAEAEAARLIACTSLHVEHRTNVWLVEGGGGTRERAIIVENRENRP